MSCPTPSKYAKVVDGATFSPFPPKMEDTVVISDQAGQTPQPGDDLTPTNYISTTDNASITALSLKALGATAGKPFRELEVLSINIEFDMDKNRYEIHARVKNTETETMWMQVIAAQPAQVLGSGISELLVEGVVRTVDVLKNEDAARVAKAFTASEKHTVLVNEVTTDGLMLEMTKVPAGAEVDFHFSFDFKAPLAWRTKVTSKKAAQIAECVAMLPEVRNSYAPPLTVTMRAPAGARIVIPDVAVANYMATQFPNTFLFYAQETDEEGRASFLAPNGLCVKGLLVARFERLEDDDGELIDFSELRVDNTGGHGFVKARCPVGEDQEAIVIEYRTPQEINNSIPTNKKVRIVFELDLSGSMYMCVNGNETSNRDNAKKFIAKFLDLLHDTLWPALKKKHVGTELILTISWFTHTEGTLGEVSLEEEGVEELKVALQNTTISGGTLFTPFLSTLARSIDESVPTLVVILSDGGDHDRETCLKMARAVHENHGTEFLTFGIGAWLDERLMHDLTTVPNGCVLLKDFNESFIELLATKVTRALLGMSAKARVEIASKHRVVSVQNCGVGALPKMTEEPVGDAFEVRSILEFVPGSKYTVTLLGRAGDPPVLRCNDQDARLGAADHAKIDPFAVLLHVDSTLVCNPAIFPEQALCKFVGTDVALQGKLNSQWTRKVVGFTLPQHMQLKPITPQPQPESMKCLLKDATIQNPYYEPPIFRSFGGGSFRGGGQPKYRGLGAKGAFRTDDVNASAGGGPPPSALQWFARNAPLHVPEYDEIEVLCKMMKAHPVHSHGKRTHDDEDDNEAAKLVKMALEHDAKQSSPSDDARKNDDKMYVEWFLRFLVLKYDLKIRMGNDDLASTLAQVTELLRSAAA